VAQAETAQQVARSAGGRGAKRSPAARHGPRHPGRAGPSGEGTTPAELRAAWPPGSRAPRRDHQETGPEPPPARPGPRPDRCRVAGGGGPGEAATRVSNCERTPPPSNSPVSSWTGRRHRLRLALVSASPTSAIPGPAPGPDGERRRYVPRPGRAATRAWALTRPGSADRGAARVGHRANRRRRRRGHYLDAPGQGTSVMLRVPLSERRRDPSVLLDMPTRQRAFRRSSTGCGDPGRSGSPVRARRHRRVHASSARCPPAWRCGRCRWPCRPTCRHRRRTAAPCRPSGSWPPASSR